MTLRRIHWLGLAAGLFLASAVGVVGCFSQQQTRTTGASEAIRRGTPEPPPREQVLEVQRGRASWYSDRLHGRKTANGERYDKHRLTAAHRSLPFGSIVRVTNEKNGRHVRVRINDRGPFGKRRRIIDLSRKAAAKLGMLHDGVVPVKLEVLEIPQRRK